MFNNQIYEDIARRTGGDIYVGGGWSRAYG